MTLFKTNIFTACKRVLIAVVFVMPGFCAQGQGVWTKLVNDAPDYNKGVMLLLTDGSVMVKTSSGGGDAHGTFWNKLTPDIHGSYVNGTWDRIAPMADTRLYFSSQVLKDGRVYVAGGEYGTGRSYGEVYDPIDDYWRATPRYPNVADTISDANSEILEDGRVLQAIVKTGNTVSNKTYIYDPVTNTNIPGPSTLGIANESSWVKLPDNSILFVDIFSTNSERYIPATNTWIADSSVPVGLYDQYGRETGSAFLLPDGRAFFLGSVSTSAYFTPSGNMSKGIWSAGPAIPAAQGAPDAAAAMMTDGNILCAFSPIPSVDSVFAKPMTFYEFNYQLDSFIKIKAPDGKDSIFAPSYFSNMLCLPDGNILYCTMGSDEYHIYTPAGAPLAAGKPVLESIIKVTCDTFMAIGKGFNGITEGAGYGDDWQMASNYPLVRFTTNDSVIYARTFNWNSTGVSRGTKPDTTWFALPAGLPNQTYQASVVANGNASVGIPFATCAALGVESGPRAGSEFSVYPNPASTVVTVAFKASAGGEYSISVYDVAGRVVVLQKGTSVAERNAADVTLDGLKKGVYTLHLNQGGIVYSAKLMVK